jgi:hypothetical protein
MNEKGNLYAIAALEDRRATLGGEIVKFTRASGTGKSSWLT